MVEYPDSSSAAMEGAMDLNSILARCTKVIGVSLLFVASVVSGEDARMVSPPLTMKSGTTLSVRINELLSSDRNRVGDVFSATLTQPVVVLGIVVASPGQTVIGHVVEVKKAGRVSGVSRLGITLTNLTLVDGQSVPIRSQLVVREGPTSVGRDAIAITGTTGLGAAIGAVANGGPGAAIGAAAGAAASSIGVLLTRGSPTMVYPEMPLLFEMTAPVTIETNNAPEAFHFVNSADYPQAQPQTQTVSVYPSPAPLPHSYPYYVHYAPSDYPYFSYYPYFPYYPYYSGFYGHPYFYGTSFSFFLGSPAHYYRSFYGGHFGFVYPSRPAFGGGVIAFHPGVGRR